MDIAALVRRCKHKDRQAFDELLSRYEQSLYKICRWYSQDKDEALDIMQEVYIKIFRHIQTFDESRPILPWLKQLTVNTCLNFRRDHKQPLTLALDAQPLEVVDRFAHSSDDVEEQVMQRSSVADLDKILATLPDHHRMALSLRYLEDMTYEQIAQMMDLPLGTVKSHLHRGRAHLRQELTRQGWMEV